MPITLDGTNGITTPMYNGSITANAVTPSVNMKNRIINGAMVIDQRNAGASVTNTTSSIYTVDRWQCYGNNASKFTVQQSSTAPAGFVNSVVITSSAATSVGAGDQYYFTQLIEGYNVADLNLGSATNAKTFTVSFWARASVTGTYSIFLLNGNADLTYTANYTVSSANTWAQYSITITAPTSGTWLTTNGIGLYLGFDLGSGSNYNQTAGSWQSGNKRSTSGSTQLVATSGATLYITGVQLEVGSTATSFDYRPYGTELALCQRYCFAHGGGVAGGGGSSTSCVIGLAFSSNQSVSVVQFPVSMRTLPSLTVATPSNFYTNNIGANTNSSNLTANTASPVTGEYFATLVSSALTTNQPIRFFGNASSLAIWSAEL